MYASLSVSVERKARRRSAPSRTLPRCLHARRCCILSLRYPKEVFPSPGRTWTSSWIFRDGALPPRFSPRSFLADRRTPASSQWHGPAKPHARPSFAFMRFTLMQKPTLSEMFSFTLLRTLSQMRYADNGGFEKETVSHRVDKIARSYIVSLVFSKKIFVTG